jgi:hypothetical protein
MSAYVLKGVAHPSVDRRPKAYCPLNQFLDRLRLVGEFCTHGGGASQG